MSHLARSDVQPRPCFCIPISIPYTLIVRVALPKIEAYLVDVDRRAVVLVAEQVVVAHTELTEVTRVELDISMPNPVHFASMPRHDRHPAFRYRLHVASDVAYVAYAEHTTRPAHPGQHQDPVHLQP